MEDISIEKRIQVLEGVIKKATQELDSLKEELNNKEKCNTAHVIPIGSLYYYITSKGTVESYINSGDSVDKAITKNSYVYRTKSEAREWQIALQMQRKLRDLCEQYPVDWDSANNKKYSISWSGYSKTIEVGYCYFTKSTDYDYYSSAEDVLENFVQQEGEENIKKYLFGIGLPPRYKLEIK